MAKPEDFAHHYRRASCVFFDCDGVIFDSNGFKRHAMRRALLDCDPELVAAMDAYWTRNGGVSRFDKFEHFFTHIAPVHGDSERRQRIAQAVERFGAESLAAYRQVAPDPLALKLAQATGPERCVVVSGAAREELQAVFDREGITRFFSEVLGSPPTKLKLVQWVLGQRQLNAQDCLLIGDGGNDFRVCVELRIPFVYLHQYSEWPDARSELSAAPNVLWAEDWRQLTEWFGID